MVARANIGVLTMKTETTTAARADIVQLSDNEIDAVGGGYFMQPINLVRAVYEIGKFFRWW